VQPFATLADIAARYPAELTVLAADEVTGLRDDVRAEKACEDASAEVRAILKARYEAADFSRLDADSRGFLRLVSIDIALYRVALSFSRGNERVKERYDAAVKRLEAIASGKGGLSFEGGAGPGGEAQPGEPATVAPNEVLIDAPERVFTRNRLAGL